MRNLFVALIVFSVLLSSSGRASDDAACRHFLDSIQKQVNKILLSEQMSFTEKRSSLTTLFEQSVDVEWVARAVSQDYWNKASEQDRKDFVTVYRPYLSDHYIGGLDEEDYREMTNLVVVDFKRVDNASYIASTQVKRKADDPMNFDIRLEEQPQGSCHVRDFTIDGVSQVSTQTAEIQSLAAKGGLKYVTQKLVELRQTALK